MRMTGRMIRSPGVANVSPIAASSHFGVNPPRSLPVHQQLVRVAAALLLTGSTAAAQATALLGGTVIDGTGKPGIPNAVVIVTGDRISCVGTAAQCPVP